MDSSHPKSPADPKNGQLELLSSEAPTPTTAGRLKRIQIEKLFRQVDIDIPLNLEDHVTVLHGRNGVGKTMTLTMVDALKRGDLGLLVRTPFSRLLVELDSGDSIEVTRSEKLDDEQETGTGRRSMGRFSKSGPIGEKDFSVLWHRANRVPVTLPVEGILNALIETENRLALRFPRIDSDHWLDENFEDSVNREELVARYPQLFADGDAVAKEPHFAKLLQILPATRFIQTQRLLAVASGRERRARREALYKSSVAAAADDVSTRLGVLDSRYTALSTQLDSTLPERLFKQGSSPAPEYDDILSRSNALEQERERLRRSGLLRDKSGSFDLSSIPKEQLKIFSQVLQDNEEKIQVFKGLADRAQLLLKILKSKFHPKQVGLDREKGYIVTSGDGRDLALEKLSSGEQHELIMMHDLLFRVHPGSLLLLDEPELSLHPTWQKQFMNDLLEITKLVNIDVILATHSPYIVGNRDDLMVQLGEPE